MSPLSQPLAPSIVALAGRRIDLPGAAPPRFPLERVPEVGQLIADRLRSVSARALVCSGACGADLVALEEAARMGLRRRIILPFDAERFCGTSVSDRPGEWAPIFERQIAAAITARDLVVVGDAAGDEAAAYARANESIVREAQSLGQSGPFRLIAMLVWEGSARSPTDATAGFGALARDAGFEVQSILTV